MTSSGTVSTKKIDDRRTLRFGRAEDLVKDIEALASCGEITSTGNWTPAQIVEHVTRFMDWSLDGFPKGKMALPIRLFGRLIKDRALNRPLSPGFKVPGPFQDSVPDASFDMEAARTHLRRTVGRVEKGERMEQPSPLLGPLEHEQWVQLHCRHAEMHFSFLKV